MLWGIEKSSLSAIINPDLTGRVIRKPMEKERAHLKITGRVQGVGFRNSTKRKANQLGLTGWVKNLADGSVEAVVEGRKPEVNDLISWANRGPRLATVDKVKVDRKEYRGEFSGFSIRY
jgi:acylphosphatase